MLPRGVTTIDRSNSVEEIGTPQKQIITETLVKAVFPLEEIPKPTMEDMTEGPGETTVSNTLDDELEALELAHVYEESRRYFDYAEQMRAVEKLHSFQCATPIKTEEEFQVETGVGLEAVRNSLKSIQSSNPEASKNNIQALHLIVGHQVVTNTLGKYTKDAKSFIDETQTTVYCKNTKSPYGGLNTTIKNMAAFLGWLASHHGYRTAFNQIIQARLDKCTDASSLQEIARLNAKKQIVGPFGGNAVILWSLEGILPYLQTKNVNKLHYHIIVFLPKSINTTRATFIMTSLKEFFGNQITYRTIRSWKQVSYIMKEQQLVCSTLTGISVPEPRQIVEALSDNSELIQLFDGQDRLYESCSYCADSSPLSNLVFAKQIGFNYDAAIYYNKTDNKVFRTHFSNFKSYSSFLEACRDPSECFAWVEASANYPMHRLRRILEWELGCRELAMRAFRILMAYFRHYIQSSTWGAPTMNWIGANVASVRRGEAQTFCKVLCIGGPGGVGKSTFVKCLQSGVGFPSEKMLFKKHSVDRSAHSAISMFRFYDEAPVQKASKADVFTHFVELELPTSRLYGTNIQEFPCKFLILANAYVTGLPTKKDFVEIKGRQLSESMEGEDEYRTWHGMAKRRFEFMRLSGYDEFIMSNVRCFEDSEAIWGPKGVQYVGIYPQISV